MDRHVKWLRRRIIASIATQTAEVFAVVAVAAFALMYWRTDEGPVTSLFGAVVVAQLVAGARIGHAMRNNPLNYVFMRKYVDNPFTYRVSRFQGEEEAHAVAERLPGFAPVATIRDREADPEPVFDVYHDPSRLVAASVSRASGSVALISSLADGRIMVTDARAIPPHERLVMNLTPEDSLDSVIATHRRAISARSDVVELASSAHQVALDSLAVEYESYVALGPALSPFLDLESNRRSWLRLTARITTEELASLPVRLGPDLPLPASRVVPVESAPAPAQPSTSLPASAAAATPVAALPVPQMITPAHLVATPADVVAPDITVPDVVSLDAATIAPAGVVVPESAAPQVLATTAPADLGSPPMDVLASVLEPSSIAEPTPAEAPPVVGSETVTEPAPTAVADGSSELQVEPGPANHEPAVEAGWSHEVSTAPALSAVTEPEVVALVIPDPRKTPLVEKPVVASVVDAAVVEPPAENPGVDAAVVDAAVVEPVVDSVGDAAVVEPVELAEVVAARPVAETPPVGVTPFVTVEPDPGGIDDDPAPITTEVPVVVAEQPPAAGPLAVDLVGSLPTKPTIDAIVPTAAATPITSPELASAPVPVPPSAAAAAELVAAPQLVVAPEPAPQSVTVPPSSAVADPVAAPQVVAAADPALAPVPGPQSPAVAEPSAVADPVAAPQVVAAADPALAPVPGPQSPAVAPPQSAAVGEPVAAPQSLAAPESVLAAAPQSMVSPESPVDVHPAAPSTPAPTPATMAPVGPPATLAEAVQPAPDTPAALIDAGLQQAPPADWQQPGPDITVHAHAAELPNLATALGYGETPSPSRPRLSAVLRANSSPTTTAPPQKRTRRKSR